MSHSSLVCELARMLFCFRLLNWTSAFLLFFLNKLQFNIISTLAPFVILQYFNLTSTPPENLSTLLSFDKLSSTAGYRDPSYLLTLTYKLALRRINIYKQISFHFTVHDKSCIQIRQFATRCCHIKRSIPLKFSRRFWKLSGTWTYQSHHSLFHS